MLAASLSAAPMLFPAEEKAAAGLNKLSLETTLSASSENNRICAGAGLPLGIVYSSLNDLTYGKEGVSYSAKHDLRRKIAGPLSVALSYYFVPTERNEAKLGLQLDMPKFLGLEGFVQGLYDLRNAQDNILLGHIKRNFSDRGHVGVVITTKPARHTLYFELEAALRIKDDIYLFGQMCGSNTTHAVCRAGIKVNLVAK